MEFIALLLFFAFLATLINSKENNSFGTINQKIGGWQPKEDKKQTSNKAPTIKGINHEKIRKIITRKTIYMPY